MRDPRPSELQLHRSVAEYLDWALMPPALYTTFPAGWGKLGPMIAGQLKASGLKRGFPDIFVFDKHRMIANQTYTKVIGIELKARDAKPSAAQQIMFPKLRDLGVPIYVCTCLEDVEGALRRESILLRRIKWQDEQPARRKKPPAEISAKPEDTRGADGTEIGTAN